MVVKAVVLSVVLLLAVCQIDPNDGSFHTIDLMSGQLQGVVNFIHSARPALEPYMPTLAQRQLQSNSYNYKVDLANSLGCTVQVLVYSNFMGQVYFIVAESLPNCPPISGGSIRPPYNPDVYNPDVYNPDVYRPPYNPQVGGNGGSSSSSSSSSSNSIDQYYSSNPDYFTGPEWDADYLTLTAPEGQSYEYALHLALNRYPSVLRSSLVFAEVMPPQRRIYRFTFRRENGSLFRVGSLAPADNTGLGSQIQSSGQWIDVPWGTLEALTPFPAIGDSYPQYNGYAVFGVNRHATDSRRFRACVSRNGGYSVDYALFEVSVDSNGAGTATLLEQITERWRVSTLLDKYSQVLGQYSEQLRGANLIAIKDDPSKTQGVAFTFKAGDRQYVAYSYLDYMQPVVYLE